jgi:hypothetical protein
MLLLVLLWVLAEAAWSAANTLLNRTASPSSNMRFIIVICSLTTTSM